MNGEQVVVIGGSSGIGLAVARMARAEGAVALSLVALGGTAPFWAKHGFAQAFGAGLSRKIAGYGAGAAFMERRPA